MKILSLNMNSCLDRTYWVEEFGQEPVRMDEMSGGKGTNAARVLTQLGEDCIEISAAGGEAGRRFEDLARSEGVNLISIPLSGVTRTITTYVRIRDYAQQVVREKGPEMSGEEIDAIRQSVVQLLPECGILAVCGSSPSKKGNALICEMITLAKSMGIKTFLDASDDTLIETAPSGPDVLKINENEIVQLMGPSDDPMFSQAARLCEKFGIERVIITLGDRGCAQYSNGQTLFCPSPRVETINAVGSGDCFTAGWIHAQIRGFSDQGALMLACAAGAANAAQFPAAKITRADIEKIVGFTWN